MFLSKFQNVLFYYQDIKLTLKKTLSHDVNKKKDIKQLHSGKHANSIFFHYHVNIILKLMVDFVTELVEIAPCFSTAKESSFRPSYGCRFVIWLR